MRYRNKRTGVVVDPPDAMTAQTFARSADWAPVGEPPGQPAEKPKRPRRGKKGGGGDAAGD